MMEMEDNGVSIDKMVYTIDLFFVCSLSVFVLLFSL